MALSVSAIKATIKAKREAQFGAPADAAIADKAYQADAEAIFEILTVQATVTVASVSGVTPGGGASGPGTGTIG